MNKEAKDVLNRGWRFLHEELKARPDPLADFLRVQKPDFQRSIHVCGFKADAQDFFTDLHTRFIATVFLSTDIGVHAQVHRFKAAWGGACAAPRLP